MTLRDEICSAMESYMMSAPADWNVIDAAALKKAIDAKERVLILDVREPSEYSSGHVPGAVNISVRQLPSRVKELPQEMDTRIVAYCASGIRSAYATMFLRVYGYKEVRSLEHGIRDWMAAGYPVT